jgi:ADP-heptose:LPS heptosyltransferase
MSRKILAVSLLRLGDFLQILPVLNGLKQKYPDAEVDVLVHSSVEKLKPMLPQIGRWWTLDRDSLQSGLGQADLPLLTSFDVLRETMNAIQDCRYDFVINLTQTAFSGWLTGYLKAPEKNGLCLEADGRAYFHSPWFRYLDREAENIGGDIFNYTDIFFEGCELAGFEKSWELTPTRHGEEEVSRLELDEGRPILAVQALTSDEKKNWDMTLWAECLTSFARKHPDWQTVLLGAPFESEHLEELRERIEGDARMAILSMEGALSLLNRSTILLTSDTSIKHLANGTGVRVLELSLGSSDYQRTGVYREGNLILNAQVPCGPCRHSAPCGQASHRCGLQIRPQEVSEALSRFAAGDWEGLSALARKSPLKYLRTRHLEQGIWFAQNLAEGSPQKTMDLILERLSLKSVLNQEFKRELTDLGTQGVRAHRDIERLFAGSDRDPLLAHLDFLEKDLSSQNPPLEVARRQLVREHAGQAFDLTDLRRIQSRQEDRHQRLEYKIKLIRSLKSRMVENS